MPVRWLSRPSLAWSARSLAPCCLAKALTHWPTLSRPGLVVLAAPVPTLALQPMTACTTRLPQLAGFGLPVAAVAVTAAPPTTRVAAAAAIATLLPTKAGMNANRDRASPPVELAAW